MPCGIVGSQGQMAFQEIVPMSLLLEGTGALRAENMFQVEVSLQTSDQLLPLIVLDQYCYFMNGRQEFLLIHGLIKCIHFFEVFYVDYFAFLIR